jgi:hypothetical protein
MIGKASEVNIAEMEVDSINKWIHDNQEATIIDIKYSFHPEGFSWALIIYKEDAQ